MLHCNKSSVYYTKGSKKEPNQLKGHNMFDLDKQFKEVTAQVKKYNEMWINWTITVLEQIKK